MNFNKLLKQAYENNAEFKIATVTEKASSDDINSVTENPGKTLSEAYLKIDVENLILPENSKKLI